MALRYAPQQPNTATKASVNGAAVSTTLLASNDARLGASLFNDSAAILYVDMSGGTATTSSYSFQMAAGAYAEVPFGYTGLITGIWASATGAVKVTEYS